MIELEFHEGQRVRVKAWDSRSYNRTPAYLRGREGIVLHCMGKFLDQEKQAYGNSGLPLRPLYQVQFPQNVLWTEYQGTRVDSLVADLFEQWLEAAD